MSAKALQTEPLDNWRLGVQRGKGGVGAAAFHVVVHDELFAEFLINQLRMLAERSRGLARLAEPLVGVGRSEDGVLEAVLSRDHTWVIGVQWHPEAMVPLYDTQLGIFKELVDAAERYARLVPLGSRARSNG